MEIIRLAIIEDDPVIRESLESYFGAHPAIEISLVAESVEAFFEKVQQAIRAPKIDLLLLDIGLPATCVGIRFYHGTSSTPGERRMVAVGVTADGSELSQRGGAGYFTSDAVAAGSTKQAITKAIARGTVAPMNSKSFTSFFSKTMLQERLLASEPVGGVRFYQTSVSDFSTHLGVAAGANGAILAAALAGPFSHVVSDLPCPGRCATIGQTEAAQTDALSAPLTRVSFTELDTEKYVDRWQAG